MDPLSEILRVITLDSAVYFNAEFSEPWCLASPESRTLAPIFSRAHEHVIIYHLLCEGTAWIQIEDGDRWPPPARTGPIKGATETNGL